MLADEGKTRGQLIEELEALRAGPVRPHPAALVFRQPCGSSWADPRAINRRLKTVVAAISEKDIPAWKLRGADWKPVNTRLLCVQAERVFYTAAAPIFWMMMAARYAIHIQCPLGLIIRESALSTPG